MLFDIFCISQRRKGRQRIKNNNFNAICIESRTTELEDVAISIFWLSCSRKYNLKNIICKVQYEPTKTSREENWLKKKVLSEVNRKEISLKQTHLFSAI